MVYTPGRSDAYRALTNGRRRRLLSLLSETGPTTVEKLARRLANREETGDSRNRSGSAVDRIGIELVHNHLPRLDDGGYLDYNRETGSVVPMTKIVTRGEKDDWSELQETRPSCADGEIRY